MRSLGMRLSGSQSEIRDGRVFTVRGFARTLTPSKGDNMGFEDLTNQAKDALNSEKGEEFSDQGLDKASDFADGLSGGKFGEQIDQGREAADGHVGTE